jgi:5'-nucleotidase
VQRLAGFASLAFVAALTACRAQMETHPPDARPARSSSELAAPPRSVTISIVGTNDVHGRVENLPVFGGYLANLRRARQLDGGVLLVDAGDVFQGTLESNLGEGTAMIAAYAALGYQAVAVGNHEFDYGPAGAAVTPTGAGEDARGALKARAAEAPFPFLAANLLDGASKRRVDWPNMPASVTVAVAGVKVGIVGATTEETLETTMRSNVSDLAIAPLAETLGREAAALRKGGAQLVVAAVHAGGKCERFTGAVEADACQADSEIFRAARALPAGAIDVIVAGHSHAGLAHRVNGVAIIESNAYGRAFGRVDVTLGGTPMAPTTSRIFPPRAICQTGEGATCVAGSYEAAPVVADAKVAAAIAPHIEVARQKRNAKVGVKIEGVLRRAYGEESALGNLFADLTRATVPAARTVVGLMNGGGLRADLPAGDLLYGQLYEAFPFDNKVAVVTLKAADLSALLAHHLASAGGILSLSGVDAAATCKAGSLVVTLRRRPGGQPLLADETLDLVASDFLLTGGDGFWGSLPVPRVDTKELLLRDAWAAGLAKRGKVREADVFDPRAPRLAFPGKRPVRCKD